MNRKLTLAEIENINKNMVEKETEKAMLLKFNCVLLSGEEKVVKLWIPKVVVKKTNAGILTVDDWFKKKKENELKCKLFPYLEY